MLGPLLSKIATQAIGIFVLLPLSWVAIFLTLAGVPWSLESLGRPNYGEINGAAVLALLATGWFGIVTLWHLYYRATRGEPVARPQLAWAGLVAGTVTAVALCWVMRSWWPAWPATASLYFGFWLRRFGHGA